ncbi:MAG: ammonia-forming cytochrome c nitrite reductase subunit c552, partial [Armatimonadetes bacterium]|nr:ammonia-forming cytochrome c nitrite reductase subunit c552 [Armatimonadota bacterium]
PDFVYFNHSIHIQKGIGCDTCHGPIHEMNITYKAQPLSMAWCLDCHRQPEKYIRPKEEVYNYEYKQPANQLELGAKLVKEYGIRKEQLTDCSVCHR